MLQNMNFQSHATARLFDLDLGKGYSEGQTHCVAIQKPQHNGHHKILTSPWKKK